MFLTACFDSADTARVEGWAQLPTSSPLRGDSCCPLTHRKAISPPFPASQPFLAGVPGDLHLCALPRWPRARTAPGTRPGSPRLRCHQPAGPSPGQQPPRFHPGNRALVLGPVGNCVWTWVRGACGRVTPRVSRGRKVLRLWVSGPLASPAHWQPLKPRISELHACLCACSSERNACPDFMIAMSQGQVNARGCPQLLAAQVTLLSPDLRAALVQGPSQSPLCSRSRERPLVVGRDLDRFLFFFSRATLLNIFSIFVFSPNSWSGKY